MNKVRPFLKWAGGKYLLTEEIYKRLPQGDCLIEPFVGAGAVFLNSNQYKQFILNDINPDLINLYKLLAKSPEQLIAETQRYFTQQYNDADAYYQLREAFNQAEPASLERAALFIYLNRHGYNGLCRYNASGGFNVPFGRYKGPNLPVAEMNIFAERAQNAKFTCTSFEAVFKKAKKGSVVYCDPPYADLTEGKQVSFTGYAATRFAEPEQRKLAELAERAAKRGIPVLISNHDTQFTREIYHKSEADYIKVRRYISRDIDNRREVQEVFALYSTGNS